MKILRLLLVVALLSFSASVILADGVDPLVGIGHGNGSTPITVTNPNPTFNLTTVLDPGVLTNPPGPGTTCTFAGDVCAVDPKTGMLPVFQNDLGTTIPTLTIFIQNIPLTPLTYTCNNAELSFFATCTTVSVAGGTDVIFSGGTGVPALIFYPDDDLDDESCASVIPGPEGPPAACSDDFVPTEFTVDIEGTVSGDPTTDLPQNLNIQGSVVTSPEPGSALMLLFGMFAFALAKVARRA